MTKLIDILDGDTTSLAMLKVLCDKHENLKLTIAAGVLHASCNVPAPAPTKPKAKAQAPAPAPAPAKEKAKAPAKSKSKAKAKAKTVSAAERMDYNNQDLYLTDGEDPGFDVPMTEFFLNPDEDTGEVRLSPSTYYADKFGNEYEIRRYTSQKGNRMVCLVLEYTPESPAPGVICDGFVKLLAIKGCWRGKIGGKYFAGLTKLAKRRQDKPVRSAA